ncbi:PRTRC genetic system protein C [Dysgonomonas sp. PFB1-18]|uniref:PRTRC system protein C n=1 Tax=unclassified Dysgonomonas TaxID=2630389 RepID=UPI0024769926|nr:MULTISPECIES: PRTRC system protein C [unclassified Dysgonomonas]MDH6310931.1 PRTRC genetic system protein C [Dysgonomonas sp. PF1-14]MDH6340854.1 PRTRC genetic system protein C [Dysgonomonas sp. PF1-16]MDH6382454.1 PRTRC genetic system protein C [Dysgonomonas sp. PFB1-18]MDH6399803.1 PRTRC genetic system protein C [Dysgonomonas sp. PF1-23]
MALEIKDVSRELVIEKKGVRIPLQDPDMTIDEAMAVYSSIHPELTTSTVTGPFYEDDKYVYKVKTTIGTKG